MKESINPKIENNKVNNFDMFTRKHLKLYFIRKMSIYIFKSRGK